MSSLFIWSLCSGRKYVVCAIMWLLDSTFNWMPTVSKLVFCLQFTKMATFFMGLTVQKQQNLISFSIESKKKNKEEREKQGEK